MKFSQEQHGEVTIVDVDGRVDSSTAKPFEEKLVGLLESGRILLMIDFKHLAYISSAGFRVLLRAGQLAEKRDGKLVLCNINSEVRRIFDLGGLTELFSVYGSREEGVAQFAQPS
jgi:anti-sigma B factor antagonist